MKKRNKRKVTFRVNEQELNKLTEELIDVNDKLSADYVESFKSYVKAYEKSYNDLHVYFDNNEAIDEIMSRSFFEILRAKRKERKRIKKASYL